MLFRFNRVFVLLNFIAALSDPAFSQCTINPSMGVKSAEWDSTFIQYGPGKGLEPKGSAGWTGGDATFSLLLPNGDSAFFFSDSYIGEWPATKGDGTVSVRPDGARVVGLNCPPPYCDPPAAVFAARNSVVIRSKNGKRLRTLVGPKNENGLSTSFFKEPEAGRYFWVGDQIILADGNIAIFLHKFDAKLEFHGTTVAEIDSKTFSVKGVYESALPNNVIHWGSALLEENGYLYIYGKGTIKDKKLPFVARTRSYKDAKEVANTRNWESWNGTQWVADLAAAVPLVTPTDSISDEFSVERFIVDGKPTLIMVALDTTVHFHNWRDITLYSACQPQGPFVGKHVVYAMPESAAKSVWGTKGDVPLKSALVVYNPHIHKQFTKGNQLLISYNPNRIDNADTIFVDGYRPRFIYVPVAGLR